MYQYGTGYQSPYGGYYPQTQYSNPYGSTGVMQQPGYMQQSVQQTQQTQQQPAYTYLPLTFVNGIDDVNKFVVPLNQSVYLRDSTSDTLYIKSTNTQGQTSIEQFQLVKSNGLNANQPKVEYATKDDFNVLTGAFSELRNYIETSLKDYKREG